MEQRGRQRRGQRQPRPAPGRAPHGRDNPKTGFQFDCSDSTLTRNLAAADGTNASLGSNSSGSGNSWDLGGSWSFTSTSPATTTGPRTADGSIPSSTFLRPSNGADVGARF